MANIIQNFSDKLINLTKLGHSYDIFDERNGDYIRMTVMTPYGDLLYVFYSDRQWTANGQVYFDDEYLPYMDAGTSVPLQYEDVQIPIYRDESGRIFVKPNEVFDKATDLSLKIFDKGDYTIRFDFIRSIKLNTSLNFSNSDGFVGNNLEFYIGEISPSRKEVRIVGRQTGWDASLNDGAGGEVPNDPIDFGYGSFESTFISQFGDDDIDGYAMNLFLDTGDTDNMVITNYEFDNISDPDSTSIVLKLHKSLPTTVQNYTSIDIIKEVYPTQFEEVKYFDEQIIDVQVATLEPDWGVETNSNLSDEVNFNQSYDDLINSSSMSSMDKTNILYKIFSGSKHETLNIDYDKLENHSFFGSAEYKLRNFYNKVKLIESYSIDLSASMNTDTYGFLTASADVQKRKNIFSNIENIVSNFTPYEHWMYNDFSSSNSWPNPGKNYIKSPPISGSYSGSTTNKLTTNAEVMGDYYGMDVVYKISTADDHEFVTSGSFTGADALMNTMWDTGSKFDGHHTASNRGGWYFDSNKLFYSGSDTSHNKITQNVFTSSDGSTVDQFIINQTYKIEFDVVDFYKAGEVRFDFGVSAGAPQRKSFTISGAGHQKDLLQLDSLQTSPNNKLVIQAFSGFSGSIDNISIVRTTDQDGKADIFNDTYFAENPLLGHYDGRWYLSFWAKWQELPTWENSNASQSSAIPKDAWSGEYTQSSWANDQSESFHHFVLAASQSYWRFKDDSASQSDSLTEDEAVNNPSNIWEILSGTDVTGSYVMDDLVAATEYENLVTYGGRSILPSGELFRIYNITSSENSAPVTQSFLTDIKLWRGDSFDSGSRYSASISDVIPFTNVFATSSTAVDVWYEEQLYSASLYDKDNIHSLYNTLPNHVRVSDSDRVLEKYLSAIGEQFDMIKNYIDNFILLNKRSYDKFDSVPDSLVRMVGENFGWEFFDPNAFRGLLQNVIGSYGDDSHGEFTKQIWKNILNNLIYIYKSKGTEESIRSLINSFGIPPNIITVAELGSNDTPQFRQSPGVYDLTSNIGIRNSTGSSAYNETIEPFYFLNFNENNHSFTPKWNRDGTGHLQSLELMFYTYKANDQVLAYGSGSQGEWELGVAQSPESSSGMMTFYCSQSYDVDTNPVGTIIGSNPFNDEEAFAVTSSADELKVWNVIFEKRSATSFHFKVAHKPSPRVHNSINPEKDDTLVYSGSRKVTATPTVIEQITSSHASWPESSLVFGPNFTGSMTNFRAYDICLPENDYTPTSYASMSNDAFWARAFNPHSVNRLNIDRTILPKWSYNFNNYSNNQISSGSAIVNQYPNPAGDNFDEILDPTFTNPHISKKYLTVFRTNPRGLDNFNQRNTRGVLIGKQHEFIHDGVKPDKMNTLVELNDVNRSKNSKISLFLSPVNFIDNRISDILSDKDVADSLVVTSADDKALNYYPGLQTLRNQVFDQISSGMVNINDWIRRNEKLIPSELFEYIDRLTPVEVDTSPGILIKNHMLYRNKHNWGNQSGRATTGVGFGTHLKQINKMIIDLEMDETELIIPNESQTVSKYLIKENASISDVIHSNILSKNIYKINSIEQLIDAFGIDDLVKLNTSIKISSEFTTPYTLLNQMLFSVQDNYTFYHTFITNLISNTIDKDVLSEIVATLFIINPEVGKVDVMDAISSFENSLLTVLLQEIYSAQSINKSDYTLKGQIISLIDYIQVLGLSDESIKLTEARKLFSELLDHFYTAAISKNDLLNILQSSLEQVAQFGLKDEALIFEELLNITSKSVQSYTSNSIFKATDLLSRSELQRIMFEVVELIQQQNDMNISKSYNLYSMFMTTFFSELVGVIDKKILTNLSASLGNYNIGIDTARINKSDLYKILSSMLKIFTLLARIDKSKVLNISGEKVPENNSQWINKLDFYTLITQLLEYLKIEANIDIAQLLNINAEKVPENNSQFLDLNEYKDLLGLLFDQFGDGQEIGWTLDYAPDSFATAYLTFAAQISTIASYHTRTFTLRTTGNEKHHSYIWDTTGAKSTGELGGPDGKHITIQLIGMSSFTQIYNETKTAIETTVSGMHPVSDFHVTTPTTKLLRVWQRKPGSAGNTINEQSGSMSVGQFSAANFSGGSDRELHIKKDSSVNNPFRKKHNLESENVFLIGQNPPKVQDRDGRHYAGKSAVTSSKLFGVINLHDEVFGNSFDRGDLNGKLRDWNAPIGQYLNPNDSNTTHFIYNPALEEARRDGSSPYRYDKTKFGFHFKSYQASPTSSYAYNSYPLAKVIGETERYVGAPIWWHRRAYSDRDGNWHGNPEFIPVLGATGSDLYYDAADKKQFMNRERDYTPGINSGKLMGSTVQIEIDTNGNIHYPPGHLLFSTDHSLVNQMNDGTLNDGIYSPSDPTGKVHRDNHPNYGSSSCYAWDLDGQPLRNQG